MRISGIFVKLNMHKIKGGLFATIFAVFCAPAMSSENLIEDLEIYDNTSIVDGIIRQNFADSRPEMQWKIMMFFDNLNHNTSSMSGSQSFESRFIFIDNSLGFMSRTFTTPSDIKDLAYFVFGINGEKRDTIVYFQVKDVMPATTYTAQWRVLNTTQGEVAWTDMRIVHCDDGYSLELGDENCSRACKNQSVTGGHIPPDMARVYEPDMCTYDAANLVCDDGYVRRGAACAALCTAGMQHIKTGNGLSFNLYKTAYSTPALHVQMDNTICYGVLAPLRAAHAININYKGMVYHTEN